MSSEGSKGAKELLDHLDEGKAAYEWQLKWHAERWERHQASEQLEAERIGVAEGMAVEFGNAAIKGALLLNGGGAVALLAFLGNAYKDGKVPPTVAGAMVYLVVGALLAVCTAGAGYFAQLLFLRSIVHAKAQRYLKDFPDADERTRATWGEWAKRVDPAHTHGVKAQILAVCLAACSLACFGVGALKAVNAYAQVEAAAATPAPALAAAKAAQPASGAASR